MKGDNSLVTRNLAILGAVLLLLLLHQGYARHQSQYHVPLLHTNGEGHLHPQKDDDGGNTS